MTSIFLLLLYKIQVSLCQFTCSPGQDCTIDCNTAQECKNALTIDCIDGYNCNINCNALEACGGLRINCNYAINCQLTCDGTLTDRPCLGIILNGQNADNVTLISKCGGVTDNTQCVAGTQIHCPQNPLGTGSCNINCETGTSCNSIAINGMNTGSVKLIVKGQTTSIDNLINAYLYCPPTKNCNIQGDTGALSLNGLQIHPPNPSDFSYFNIECIGGGTCFNDTGMILNCGATTCQVDPVTLNSCDGDQLSTSCDIPMIYALGPDSRTWQNAETYCASTYPGGHLASIRGTDEFSILQTLVGNLHVWIGLNDVQLDDNWIWSDGTQCVNNDCKTYSYWQLDEPDGSTFENCASYMNTNMYYADDDCDNIYPFVCNTYSRTTGDMYCDNGIPTSSNDVCCVTTCGQCGQAGCSNLPGGSVNCCKGSILSSGKSCDYYPAPCIISSSLSPTAQPITTQPTTLTPTTFIPTTFNPTTTNPTTFNPTEIPTTSDPTTRGPVITIPSQTDFTKTPTNEKQVDLITTDSENGDHDESNVKSDKNDSTILIIIMFAVSVIILLIGILLFYFKPWKKINNDKKSEMNVNKVEINEITHKKANYGDDDIIAVINTTNTGHVKKSDNDIVAQINQTDIGYNERSDEDIITVMNETDNGEYNTHVSNMPPKVNKIYSFSHDDELDEVKNNNDEEDVIETINYTTGANENDINGFVVDGDSENEEMIPPGSHKNTIVTEVNVIGESEGVNYTLNEDEAKEVKVWLDSIGFSMYFDILIQNGFDSMESIQEITDKSDLNDIGITLRGHQLKIMKYIKMSKTDH